MALSIDSALNSGIIGVFRPSKEAFKKAVWYGGMALGEPSGIAAGEAVREVFPAVGSFIANSATVTTNIVRLVVIAILFYYSLKLVKGFNHA